MNEQDQNLEQQFYIDLGVLASLTNYNRLAFEFKESFNGKVKFISIHNQRGRFVAGIFILLLAFLCFYGIIFWQENFLEDIAGSILILVTGIVFTGLGIWFLKTAGIEYQIEVDLPKGTIIKRYLNRHDSPIIINFKDYYGLVAMINRVSTDSDHLDEFELFGLSKKGEWDQLLRFLNEKHMDEWCQQLSYYNKLPLRKGVGEFVHIANYSASS